MFKNDKYLTSLTTIIGWFFQGAKSQEYPSLSPEFIYGQKLKLKVEMALLEREIAIWRELKHPNIIEMFSVKVTEYATFIFSEFCP
ncbi:10432_t:CDS:2, partial [Entrophospora sp. SA101]